MRKLSVAIVSLALAACSAGSGATYGPSVSTPVPKASKAAAEAPDAFKQPKMQRSGGLESITGKRADTLLQRLGRARIDLVEGDVRKLQFAGETCVLDIYLYPLSAGADPIATHVEARQRSGGAAVDKGQCLAEVERR